MTAEEWIATFAARVEVPAPDKETFDKLLALAAEAAHSSHRTAAPIACYLVGVAGTDIDAAIELAEAIGDGS